MSESSLSDLWNTATRIGADDFIVRRTMEQLETHEISFREAIDLLRSYLADHADSTNSLSSE